MDRLLRLYRTVHEQAFLPIFVADQADRKKEVEACVAAGFKAIEYTLRAPDCRDMIPWIRREFPDLFLLIGSTIDDETIVEKMRCRHPQLMTVAELADQGVDGFVSMINWTEKSIRKYCRTHLILPTASTIGEAFEQTRWGAHFQKMIGSDLAVVRRCRAAATFDFCPIMVTGGQTPDVIPDSVDAGAMLIATGFDLMLKGHDPDTISVSRIANILGDYRDATIAARSAKWPKLADISGDTPIDQWLGALPHWHPF